MKVSTTKYFNFVTSVFFCVGISYAFPENCTKPCSLTGWYSWNCTSCNHGGNRAFRQRGVCCLGNFDSVICLRICKIEQSRVLEESSCSDHCAISTTQSSTTVLSNGFMTTTSTSASTAMALRFTISKNLTSTRLPTSTAMSTTAAGLQIFTQPRLRTTISTKQFTTIIATTPKTSTLSTVPSTHTPTIANTVSQVSPIATSSLPSALCASSTCMSTRTEVMSTVVLTVPTPVSVLKTNVPSNAKTTENTGYGAKSNGSSVCLALCRRSDDWTKCMQDCLHDKDKNKLCK